MMYYIQDGEDLVVVASNAGSSTQPSWWLNLQATPKAAVDLPDGPMWVSVREADGADRDRLWSRLVAVHPEYQDLADASARHIAVVILEPSDEAFDA